MKSQLNSVKATSRLEWDWCCLEELDKFQGEQTRIKSAKFLQSKIRSKLAEPYTTATPVNKVRKENKDAKLCRENFQQGNMEEYQESVKTFIKNRRITFNANIKSPKPLSCVEEDLIKIQVYVNQTNPKRQGTKSYQRYEAYKYATNLYEFLTLGGKGDYDNDYQKGYLKVITPLHEWAM